MERNTQPVTLEFGDDRADVSREDALFVAEGLNERAAYSSIADALALRVEREALSPSPGRANLLRLDGDEQYELESLLGQADLTNELTEGLRSILHTLRVNTASRRTF